MVASNKQNKQTMFTLPDNYFLYIEIKFKKTL